MLEKQNLLEHFSVDCRIILKWMIVTKCTGEVISGCGRNADLFWWRR